MRSIMLFLFIILFTGCSPSIKTPGESTQALTLQIFIPEISETLAALPLGPTIESSQIVLRAFFDSYNSHNLAGVLATLSDTFTYGDCEAGL